MFRGIYLFVSSVHDCVCTTVCCGRRRWERWFGNWVLVLGQPVFVYGNKGVPQADDSSYYKTMLMSERELRV